MGVKSVSVIPEVNGNVAAINEAEGPVILKLALPAELFLQYKEMASQQGLTVAELLLHRLQRCVGHSSIRSLYLSESQVRQLETIVQKRPLETAEQALATVAAAFRFRIDNFDPVPITPNQAKRIHLGAIGGQTSYDRLCYIVTGAVAKATGG